MFTNGSDVRYCGTRIFALVLLLYLCKAGLRLADGAGKHVGGPFLSSILVVEPQHDATIALNVQANHGSSSVISAELPSEPTDIIDDDTLHLGPSAPDTSFPVSSSEEDSGQGASTGIMDAALSEIGSATNYWRDEAVVSASHPPKACLAMIMKNEGPILPRLFESIKGFASAYCVVDTGSTDNTIEVLRSMDMPGLLMEEPFVDFATTRNFLLETCRQHTTCEYLVLLDADMVLRVSPEWDWSKLDGADVYDFVQISSIEYANVRMIKRTAESIKVVGATHEYYDVASEYSHKLLPKHLINIDDVGDGKAKGDKFQRDERLLRRELERDPNNVRTVFYLANTLKDQGKYLEAIPFYERRATMGGWYAEADYSWFMLSSCYLALRDVTKARQYAEKAALEGWYQRAEPLYYLAFYLHRQDNHALAWYYATLASQIPKPDVSTVLFISYPIYDYWIEYERASLCRHVFPKDSKYCLHMAVAFLNNPLVPEDLRQYFFPDVIEQAQPFLSATGNKMLTADTEISGRMAYFVSRGRGVGDLELGTYNGSDESLVRYRFTASEGEDFRAMELSRRALSANYAPHLALMGGDRSVGGYSSDRQHFLMGWLPDVESREFPDLKVYAVTSPIASTSAVFGLPGATATYCISAWYPALEVGTLALDDESASMLWSPYKTGATTPRIFSLIRKASHGHAYRSDIWFLVEWQGKTPVHKLFSVVVVGRHNFELRFHTLPFTLDMTLGSDTTSGPNEVHVALAIIGRDGEEQVVVAYSHDEASGASNGVNITMIPMTEVLKRAIV